MTLQRPVDSRPGRLREGGSTCERPSWQAPRYTDAYARHLYGCPLIALFFACRSNEGTTARSSAWTSPTKGELLLQRHRQLPRKSCTEYINSLRYTAGQPEPAVPADGPDAVGTLVAAGARSRSALHRERSAHELQVGRAKHRSPLRRGGRRRRTLRQTRPHRALGGLPRAHRQRGLQRGG